jgi:hypothetical protein
LSASDDGDQTPFCFWRQSWLREARIETTRLRFSGLSEEATV